MDSQVSDYLTSCAGFLYSALLGFCLNLDIVEPLKDMTGPEHFSDQLTFFFVC